MGVVGLMGYGDIEECELWGSANETKSMYKIVDSKQYTLYKWRALVQWCASSLFKCEVL
jgi:hypothetical protein